MIKPAFCKFVLAITILFACSTIPAFAQHGGGGHGGGGFHGGGGGGGFHGGGGGFGGGFRGGSSSPPRMGAGFSRPATSAPMRSGGGSYARPGGNENRSYSATANGSARGAAPSSAPRGVADGQWHSFGNSAAARGPAASAAGAGASGSTAGGWHVIGGNRAAGSGVTRSFSGQGNAVWENAPIAHNMVSSSRAISNIHGSFANSLTGNSGLRSNASLIAGSRFAQGNTFGNRVFSNGFAGWNRGRWFGNGFNRFGWGFRGGCWNCGFGWPGLGLWNWWDPFYWDSLTWGWPGYGYYGYPAGYPYGYYPYDSGYSYSAPADNGYSNMDSSSVSAEPMENSSPQTFGVANGTVPVLLYLKNGSMYSARDYWLSGGRLHYVLLNGREGAFDVEQLDMQRTVDENAKSGVQFTLKPEPNGFAPAPTQAPPTKSPDPAPRMDLTVASPATT